MHKTFLLLTSAFLIFPFRVHTMGINCRGSFFCSSMGKQIQELTFTLLLGGGAGIGGGPINRGRVYRLNQPLHIACYWEENVCLFLQGNVPSEGVSGEIILHRLLDLNAHRCGACGSVPLSGDNDPDEMGILTANWVADPDCKGMC